MSVTQGPSEMGKLPETVTMTRDGGNYYRAMIFRHGLTWPVLPFVAVLLLLAVINPFWFRDSFFRWTESLVNRFTRWRNYKQYALYLGCDPKYWHTLKG